MANLSNINGKFVVEQTTGFVGIGTTDPAFLIEAAGTNAELALNASSIYRVRSTASDEFIITKNGVGDRLTISGGGDATFSGNVISLDTFYLQNGSGKRWQQLFDGNNWNLRYYNGSSWSADALAIDTSNNSTFAGKIYLNDTSNPDGGSGDGEGGSLIVEGRRDGTANLIALRARDASAPTVALPNGQGGLIRWQGFDGTDFAQMGAIAVVADGQAVANNDAPSKMIFYTVADGGETLTTALTLDKSQDATFTGNIKQGSRIVLQDNGTIQWGSAADYGNLTWDTGYALIYGQSGKGIKLGTNGSTLALELDTSQNATFEGTVTIPSYIYHKSDPSDDTYFGFSGNDTFVAYTAGGKGIEIDSNRHVQLPAYGSGSVTGTATYSLAVDSSGNIIEDTIGDITGSGLNGRVTFWTGQKTLSSTGNFFWDNSNVRLGIGTSTPAKPLHVIGEVRFDNDLILQPTKKLYLDGGLDTYITEVAANTIAFNTGGGERVRIDSSGQVGIGTTSIGCALQVAGAAHFGTDSAVVNPSSGQVVIETGAGNSTSLLMYTYGSSIFEIQSDGATAQIGWGSSQARTVNFTNTGAGSIAVGIGTNSPSYTLDVYHATTNVVSRFESGDNQVWIELHDDGSGSYGALLGHDSDAGHLFAVADANVTKQFVIEDSADVGIGTDSPNFRLDIVNAAASTATYQQFRNGTTGTGSGDGTVMGIDSDGDFLINNQEAKD